MTNVAVAVKERPAREPIDELVAIGSFEHVVEGVSTLALALASARGDEVEVVVAEDDDGVLVQIAREPQNFERVRAAIHDVADEPKMIVRSVEINAGEKPLERDKTSLYVSDDVGGHTFMIRHERT